MPYIDQPQVHLNAQAAPQLEFSAFVSTIFIPYE